MLSIILRTNTLIVHKHRQRKKQFDKSEFDLTI